MFWGLILRANKRYSQTVTKTFHLSQATLDATQSTSDADVQVILSSENENYILCTLNRTNKLQVPLDLVFSEGDDIAFSCVGGVVHLTGYLVPSDDDFDGFGGEEGDSDLDLGEDEEEEDEQSAQLPPKKLSKKQEALKKLLEAEHGDDTDEDDSDIDENALDGDSDDDEEGEEEEDDEDDDEIEEDDSEEEEEIVEPVAKKAKQQNGKAAPVNGKPAKAEKPVVAAAAPSAQSAKPKVLTGGVKVEDIRVGKGPEAKNGKSVQVYYEGRLQSNNKIFDSSKTGKGFSFRLGQGEVIRGWDVGVAGMKVGSKRRITCPPNMAYGAKGAQPAIPGNATLVFDVELRGIK